MRLLLFFWALLVVVPAFADEGVRIVVPAHDIARGQIIALDDLSVQTVPGGGLFSGTITNKEDLLGMEARRVLYAGQSVRPQDVRRPLLVSKGATVTMIFEAPGISLSAVGRAMSEGGMGETVTVQNPVSFRQISATVTGPGTVRAGSMQIGRIASAIP